MASLIKVDVDPQNILGRQLTELEQTQIPFAMVLAINDTSFQVREAWKEAIPLVFDRPTPLTQNAILYRKATKSAPAADIYVRDEAFKGTPPEKYLQAEVMGGERRAKRSERWLQARDILPSDEVTVPGAGAELDAFGNIKGGQLTALLSAVGAHPDAASRATDVSRYRRIKGEIKRHGYTTDIFALRKDRGKLKAGIYQRIDLGRLGSAVKPLLLFVKAATYRKRYDIFGIATKAFDQRFPANFTAALDKAVASAWGRIFPGNR